MSLLELAAVGAFLAVSAFFTGTQAALLERAGPRRSRAPRRLDLPLDPEVYSAVAMTGNALANVLMVATTVVWLRDLGAPLPALLAALGATPVVFMMGETLPRELGRRNADLWLRTFQGSMRLAVRLLKPLAHALERASRMLVLILIGLDPRELRRKLGLGELGFLYKTGSSEWAMAGPHRQLLRSAVSFSDTVVREVMVPLTEVRMVQRSASVREALELARGSGLTRFPVYESRMDEIVGVVNVYDILYSEFDREEPIKRFMHPGLFVPNTVAIDKLLFQMQSRKMPLAVVVDEFGGADGIVTVKDVVDEVMRAFEEEGPEGRFAIERKSEGVYAVDGHVSLERLNRELGLELPRRNYDTLAGFLMTELEKVPQEGDELVHGNVSFLIKKAKRHTIQKVQLSYKS